MKIFMKEMKKIAAVLLIVMMLFMQFPASVFADAKVGQVKVIAENSTYSKEAGTARPVSAIIQETRAYMLSIDKAPAVGSEWFVLGLARSGMDLNDPYFATYYNNLVEYLKQNNGVLHKRKYTEYSKTILVLTAMGKDAENVGGYNLLEPLADFAGVKRQGLNGPIWALIALSSKPDYKIPKAAGDVEQTTEEKLIQFVLGRQLEDGGWALAGKKADSDMTGMALQSLAPYYRKAGYEEVTRAADRGLDCLSSIQNEAGGYGSMGVETSESSAQVLTALTALGVDPQTDARFIKNGKWLVGNLISYHVDGSGFMHVKPGGGNNGGAAAGTVDGMSTEQGFYSLVAYQRFLDGKTSLYDMSDLKADPGKEPGEPEKEPEEPGKEPGEPEKEPEEPGKEPEGPGKESEEPGKESEEPGKGTEDPGKETDKPGNGGHTGDGSHTGETTPKNGVPSSGKTKSTTSGKSASRKIFPHKTAVKSISMERTVAPKSSLKKVASRDTAVKEETGTKEDIGAKQPWSFQGAEYKPEKALKGKGTKSIPAAANSEQKEHSQTLPGKFFPCLLCILGGGAAIGAGVYFRKRAKKVS